MNAFSMLTEAGTSLSRARSTISLLKPLKYNPSSSRKPSFLKKRFNSKWLIRNTPNKQFNSWASSSTPSCARSLTTLSSAFDSTLTRPTRVIFVKQLVEYFYLRSCQQEKNGLSPPLITSIESLSNQADSLDGFQLNELLRYETHPSINRRVHSCRNLDSQGNQGQPACDVQSASSIPSKVTDSQVGVIARHPRPSGDGLVSLSYMIIIDRNLQVQSIDDQNLEKHTVTCSGFLIETQDSQERLVVTCAHTLWQINSILSKVHSQTKPNDYSNQGSYRIFSGCLVRSNQTRDVYFVKEVVSSLSSADLIILRIQQLKADEELTHRGAIIENDEPGMSDQYGHLGSDRSILRSLPICPFAPPEQSSVSIPQLKDSDGGELNCLFEWETGRVIGYKDTMGISAQPGTYDELNTILFTIIPGNGSSGSPIINENGVVVGFVRGFQSAYHQKKAIGFGTASERIWELFQLPGLRKRCNPNPAS